MYSSLRTSNKACQQVAIGKDNAAHGFASLCSHAVAEQEVFVASLLTHGDQPHTPALCFFVGDKAKITPLSGTQGTDYAPCMRSLALVRWQYMVLDARRSRLALRPPRYVPIHLLTSTLRTSFAIRTQGTTG